MILEFRTAYVERLRYAADAVFVEHLSRHALKAGYRIDRTELDSLRPIDMAVAVATRERRVHVKFDIGPHAAGLPHKSQVELVSRLLDETVSERMDGFKSPLPPLPPQRRNRTNAAWVEVWDKERLVPTGLLIYAADDDDATEQLNALAPLLEVDCETLTICPPPGWQGFYGDERLR